MGGLTGLGTGCRPRHRPDPPPDATPKGGLDRDAGTPCPFADIQTLRELGRPAKARHGHAIRRWGGVVRKEGLEPSRGLPAGT